MLLLLGGGLALYNRIVNKSPIPAAVQAKLAYKPIYPKNQSSDDVGNFLYKDEDKTLTFITKTASGTNITIVEQPVPDSLSSGDQVYYPALGLHPYAQFQSKLGPVALTKFWKSGTLEPVGQTAVLASKGTLLLASPDKDLSNAEWKEFFNSLTIAK
jgi:hypothetical protein